MLAGLPRWLEYLHDATVGQTRMGSGGRRTRGEPEGLHGDSLAPEGDPKLLDRFLALGGINARAVRVRADVNATLVALVRHMEETRSVVYEPQNRSQPETDMARWLHTHVQSLALDEAAGEHYADVKKIVADIERVINRPPQPRFCGPCPHYVEHNRHCGRLLYARPGAIEITCAACKSTHNVDRITDRLLDRANNMRFTSAETLMIMASGGTPIPERTWRRWRTEGRVKARGYKRPDNPDGTRGAIGLHRRNDHDEPVYRLSEVRKVYATAIRHSDALTSEKTCV